MPRRREALIPAHAVPWLCAAAALAALCIAWIAEFGFGLAPCELCLWQRYAYWVAILLALGASFSGRDSRTRKALLWALAASFLGVAAIALFHAGIEYKWWQGFTACTANLGQGQSSEGILSAIENAPIVRCDEPAFVLFGLSMAGYNFLLALALAAFAASGALRIRA